MLGSTTGVEGAVTAATNQVDTVVYQWRERASQGKLVGKFGDRVESLLRAVTDSFLARTLGSAVVRDRAERLTQLKAHVAVAAKVLFQQQMVILAADVVRRFQRDLVQLSTAGPPTSEAEQLLLRKALFGFKAMSAELEVAALQLAAGEFEAELREDLKKVLADFPKSPAARLVELQRVEREVKRPRKKKGARALNLGLSLVGMFRPPGLGSLQGFTGYSTALLGLPFDILMGVQNDGESAEVLGEDREHPILRLQPKLNFDVDL